MEYTIKNERLMLRADTAGGEMVSIQGRKDGTEYLWCADPAYWKRHAPVLFPVIGCAQGKRLVIGGKEYPMGQHGFARDMEFELREQTEATLRFVLRSGSETLMKYPYPFELETAYTLEDNTVTNTWTVTNTGDADMHYHIGGHPAFRCPVKSGQRGGYYLKFDSEGPLRYGLLNKNGLLEDPVYEKETDGGYLLIADDMFEKDALIVEGGQHRSVSLCTPDRKAYVTVLFDSPVYGIWSPAGKLAPFVCIEPWWGRADRASFEGEIAQREYDQCLSCGEKRSYSFTIRFDWE